jgi:type IV secretion system protein VirB1
MLDLLALAHSCAPNVGEVTMASIIQVETGGNPLALRINHAEPPKDIAPPGSNAAAAALAREWIAAGYNIDLGIAQVNSNNLAWLGVSVEQMFDPCLNIQAAAAVLSDAYRRAVAAGKHEPLQAALSAYNTGDFSRGIQNGYVSKVLRASARYTAVARGVDDRADMQVNTVDEGTEIKGFIDTSARNDMGRINPLGPPAGSATERAVVQTEKANGGTEIKGFIDTSTR